MNTQEQRVPKCALVSAEQFCLHCQRRHRADSWIEYRTTTADIVGLMCAIPVTMLSMHRNLLRPVYARIHG